VSQTVAQHGEGYLYKREVRNTWQQLYCNLGARTQWGVRMPTALGTDSRSGRERSPCVAQDGGVGWESAAYAVRGG